ncbi:MAG: DUF6249 domain-containing protein [Chthoniobacterales bacterium]
MKTLLSFCIGAVAVAIFAQAPLPAQTPSPAPAASALATTAASASPAGDLAEKLHQRFEKKFGRHHGIVIDGGDSDEHHGDIPSEVFPIVGITMITVFGAPVAIVAVIMLINYFKARSLHRTVQKMVEKGQPVPAALLAPGALARPRSDLRRGIILLMLGLGLMLFCAAASDWEGGSWAVGIIPFVIGLGYLLVWKLEARKDVSSPPPLP